MESECPDPWPWLRGYKYCPNLLAAGCAGGRPALLCGMPEGQQMVQLVYWHVGLGDYYHWGFQGVTESNFEKWCESQNEICRKEKWDIIYPWIPSAP